MFGGGSAVPRLLLVASAIPALCSAFSVAPASSIVGGLRRHTAASAALAGRSGALLGGIDAAAAPGRGGKARLGPAFMGGLTMGTEYDQLSGVTVKSLSSGKEVGFSPPCFLIWHRKCPDLSHTGIIITVISTSITTPIITTTTTHYIHTKNNWETQQG